MPDTSKKQYIFNLSAGKRIRLYHDTDQNIWMSRLNDDGKWSEPVSVAGNCRAGFSACLDGQDGLHLVYCDANNSIFYMSFADGVWLRKPVLHRSNYDGEDLHLRITSYDNNIFIFFVLRYKGKMILAYQNIKNLNKAIIPKYIDKLSVPVRYTVSSGNSGKLLVIYNAFIDGERVPGYRIYIPGIEKWGDFIPIASSFSDYEPICSAADSSENVYLCLQKNDKGRYALTYCKVPLVKYGIPKYKMIAESADSFDNAEIDVKDDLITVYWANKGGSYCCTSADGGDMLSNEKKQENIDEKSADPTVVQEYAITEGDDTGKDDTAWEENKILDDLKNRIYETLKLMTSDMNIIRNDIQNLSVRLDESDRAFKELEKSMEKRGSEEKLIEDSVDKLKSDLELLKGQIEKHISDRSKVESDCVAAGNSGNEAVGDSPDTPLLPGAGFNHVTREFLSSLGRQYR